MFLFPNLHCVALSTWKNCFWLRRKVPNNYIWYENVTLLQPSLTLFQYNKLFHFIHRNKNSRNKIEIYWHIFSSVIQLVPSTLSIRNHFSQVEKKMYKKRREIDLRMIIKAIDIYVFPAIANKSLCYTIQKFQTHPHDNQRWS